MIRSALILIICFISIVSCKNESQDSSSKPEIDIASLEDLANQYYANDNYIEASKVFTALIALDSTNGEYYYKRGYSYGQLEKYDLRESDYLKSIEYNYKVKDSYRNLAFYYMVIHKDSLAVAYLKKYLELNPNDETAQNALDLYIPPDSLKSI